MGKIALVAGALANKPHNGGEAWVRLSWALGLRRLGFDVWLVEQIDRRACVDTSGRPVPFGECSGRAYFAEVTREFALADRAALVCADGRETLGPSYAELVDLVRSAELLVNISGHLRLEPLRSAVRRKVWIDIDPGYTQFWHADGQATVDGHDAYFTIGENIGTPRCTIPTGGIPWRPIRQPVVLADWPVCPAAGCRFTTVASWRGAFGPIERNGTRFGVKVHEFRRLARLPELVNAELEIALDIHPADQRDRQLLADHGWRLVDPRGVARGPRDFQRYIQQSAAEFSVAQGIYAETHCAWFSDRSTRYLASGKPVLVQDTGLAPHYPLGDGLLVFRTLDEAVQGIRRITDDYEHHARAARAVAERYFDSDRVLEQMLDTIGIVP
jgi:hypothetical protein